LALSKINALCTIEVYSVLGAKVYTETIPQSQANNTISLSNQPNGVYFFRVLKENGELVGQGKIIVQR
jgi:hypothetical protein